MHIDLATVDPGTGYPSAVFSKNAADLVDVHFLPVLLFPEPVYFNGNGKGLFRYHDSIEIGIERGTETVIQRFDPAGGLAAVIGKILFQFPLPCLKGADRVKFLTGKGIRGKADHYLSTGTGNSE